MTSAAVTIFLVCFRNWTTPVWATHAALLHIVRVFQGRSAEEINDRISCITYLLAALWFWSGSVYFLHVKHTLTTSYSSICFNPQCLFSKGHMSFSATVRVITGQRTVNNIHSPWKAIQQSKLHLLTVLSNSQYESIFILDTLQSAFAW